MSEGINPLIKLKPIMKKFKITIASISTAGEIIAETIEKFTVNADSFAQLSGQIAHGEFDFYPQPGKELVKIERVFIA